MVSLVEQGWADQNDVARAFGCSARTVRRDQQRFEEGGLAALGQRRGYPKGRRRLHVARTGLIHRLKTEGTSNREIARRSGVSEMAIRKLLASVGLERARRAAELLSWDQAAGCEPKPVRFLLRRRRKLPGQPGHRSGGSPRGPTAGPPGLAGGCASAVWFGRRPFRAPEFSWPCPSWSPAASSSARKRSMAASARPSMDCAPVCSRCCSWRCGASNARRGSRNTRRRTWDACWDWIGRLKSKPCGANWPAWPRPDAPPSSARLWPSNGSACAEQALGFLYVDGHVRVYHGQHRLPKTHVARMRISLPATSDYWVNDSAGDPLFVVTAEANAGLVKMLPGILDQVRALVGQRRAHGGL